MSRKKTPQKEKKKTQSSPRKKARKNNPPTSLFIGIIVIFVIIAAAAVIIASINKVSIAPSTQGIVAYVSGDPVTLEDLDAAYQLSVPDPYKEVLTKWDFLNQSFVVQRLLLQQASLYGVEITDEEVDASLDEALNSAGFSMEELEADLRSKGLTLEDVKKANKERLLISKFLNITVFSTVVVTEEEVRTFYNENNFEEAQVSFEESQQYLTEQLLYTKQNEAFFSYIQELRAQSDITLLSQEKQELIQSFSDTEGELCTQDGKPIVRMYTVSNCEQCSTVASRLSRVIFAYQGKIKGHIWELDTGDDLLTPVAEKGIPPEEVEIFKRTNSQSTVPTYNFGCAFIRIGNYPGVGGNLNREEEEFRTVIETLLVKNG